MSRGKSKKIKKFSFEGCAGDIHIGMLDMQGQPARADSFLFPSFLPCGAGRRLRPDGAICRRSSVGRARSVPGAGSRRWFKSNRLHHRRDLLPRSRTERKPAEVVFPVRCTKAAGRRNLCIGWHRLCKDERMRPTYRRRAVKFRDWSGYRRVRRKSEACHRTVCGSGVVAAVSGQGRRVGQ